ncbi:MAG: S-layer homology domain-containing protein [Actinobacteria bacterium]|nr:S-layer homology domain-containing protein [Actinomycetota bacterium]
MKKSTTRSATILLLATLILMVTTIAPRPVMASTFPDVSPSNPAYVAIEALAARGVISGTVDGYFKPDSPVTRGQTAKILVGWKKVNPSSSTQIAFRDLDATYVQYVQTAAAQGWMQGYPDGSFKPYTSLTREQMAVVVVRSLGKEADAKALAASQVDSSLRAFSDCGSISSTARPYVAFAVNWGLFSGDKNGRFNPTNAITRAQFCLVLYRADQRVSLTANRAALAAFMDTHLFKPRNSPITGEMVLQNTEWYGIPPIVQLVIMTAETGLGDPKSGGELARHNNFGCLRYHGANTVWGELSDGKIWVAGADWYSFPTPQIGMVAFGRYLKVGMNGHYLRCLTAGPPDWRSFAEVYYGQNVSGFEGYVVKLKEYEDKYRAMAAQHGLTL